MEAADQLIGAAQCSPALCERDVGVGPALIDPATVVCEERMNGRSLLSRTSKSLSSACGRSDATTAFMFEAWLHRTPPLSSAPTPAKWQVAILKIPFHREVVPQVLELAGSPRPLELTQIRSA